MVSASNQDCEAAILQMGHSPVMTKVLKEIHRTASRLQRPRSSSFTAALSTVVLLEDVIEWKDTWWWRRQQAAGQIMDPAGATGWKHASDVGNRGRTWDGVFVFCYGLEWNLCARSEPSWGQSFTEFVEKAYRFARSTVPQRVERSKQRRLAVKEARVLEDLILPWDEHVNVAASEIVGDNELVINWCNGQARAVEERHAVTVAKVISALNDSWLSGSIVPRTTASDWFRHVYRERNKNADELCNRAMDTNESTVWVNQESQPCMIKLCAHFDRGKRGDTAAAFGWHMQGSPGRDKNGETTWLTLAWASVLLEPHISSAEAELEGLCEATHAITSWAGTGAIDFCSFRVMR